MRHWLERLARRRYAREARAYIAANRCTGRPGYLHDWQDLGESCADPFYSATVHEWRCVKCGKWMVTR